MLSPLPEVHLAHLHSWLAPILALTGDRRTARTLTGIVAGILGSGSLVCTRIAAFSPSAGQRAACGATGAALRAR